MRIGVAIYRTEEGGFGYEISSPPGIFTAELTVFTLGEVIQPPEKWLLLTYSSV
jgi:hypothetical protein